MGVPGKLRVAIASPIVVAALSVCGCGDHPDAGTVNMTAIKEAAAKRGIADAKSPGAANAPAKRAEGVLPSKALPKGGR
jgi:hypothetical protein